MNKLTTAFCLVASCALYAQGQQQPECLDAYHLISKAMNASYKIPQGSHERLVQTGYLKKNGQQWVANERKCKDLLFDVGVQGFRKKFEQNRKPCSWIGKLLGREKSSYDAWQDESKQMVNLISFETFTMVSEACLEEQIRLHCSVLQGEETDENLSVYLRFRFGEKDLMTALKEEYRCSLIKDEEPLQQKEERPQEPKKNRLQNLVEGTRGGNFGQIRNAFDGNYKG